MTAQIKLHVPWIMALFAFFIGCFLGTGCGGTQPLLTILSEAGTQQPVGKVGSWWNYQARSGGPSYSRIVTSTASVAGNAAFNVTLTASPGGLPQRFSGAIFHNAVGIHVYDTSPLPGLWRLERKVPFVVGASWPMEIAPGEDSKIMKVDGMETVAVPAGTFERCYRLVETTLDSDAVPDKVERVVWVAPSIGDIKYGYVDVSGTVVVDYVLTGYYLAP